MSTRYVITRPEWGIYLGHAMGMGFWTLLDPIGQDYATTFATKTAASLHIRSWDANATLSLYKLKPVQVSASHGYATIAELRDAGLERLLGDMEIDALRYAEPAGHA